MDIKLAEVWKDKLKDFIGKIVSLNNWLIILNLTVIFTFAQQYFQLKGQKEELKKCDLILNHPWNKLRQFYEESNGNMEDYYSSEAMPWYKLCVTTSFGTTKLNYYLYNGKNDNPKLLSVINEISFAARALEPYTSNLTKIIAAQKNSKKFDDLEQGELVSLIDIFNFDSIAKQDSFKLGIGKADTFGIAFEGDKLLKILIGNKRESNSLKSNLLFAETETDFRTFGSEIFLKDIVSFKNGNLLNDTFLSLKYFIKGNIFDNIYSIKAKRNAISEKISKIESGDLIEIPLIKISISLIQFAFLSGIINLLILIYILLLYRRTSFIWMKYSGTLNDVIIDYRLAYFYNWTWSFNNKTLFVFLYSIFLSSITIASLIFATLINFIATKGISPTNFLIILSFAIVNMIFSIVVSKNYFRLKDS